MDVTSEMDAVTSQSGTETSDLDLSVTSPWMWLPLWVICLVIIFSNGLILAVIVDGLMWKSRQNLLVLFVAVCDMFRGLILFVQQIVLLGHSTLNTHLLCTITGYMYTCVACTNCISVCMLIYDRILYLSSPVNYQYRMTGRMIIFLISYPCLHGVIIILLPLAGWGEFIFYPALATCDMEYQQAPGYPQFHLIWSRIIPVIAACLCYGKVSWIVRRRVRQVRVYTNLHKCLRPLDSHLMVGRGSTTDVDKAFVRTTKILAAILCLYLLSWGVDVVLSIAMMVSDNEGINAGGYVIARLVTMATSTANPFLFAVYNRKFRNTGRKILTCGKEVKSDLEDISATPRYDVAMLALNTIPLNKRRAHTEMFINNPDETLAGSSQDAAGSFQGGAVPSGSSHNVLPPAAKAKHITVRSVWD